MAKLSLLSLYLDVFRPNQKLRYAIYVGIVFVTLFYTATFIAFCVLAIPGPGQSLIGVILSKDVASLIPISVAQGAVNVVSDFYIFLLPIPGVLQLQMPTKKKIGVCAIFATGSLACLASIMGLYYRTKLNRDSDVTWSLVDILIWVVVELHVGVMCGCMPAFAGFFNYYLPLLRSFGSFFSSRVKGFSLLKLSSRPSSSESSSKRLTTKDIKVTLGSRIDGHGHFINPTTYPYKTHAIDITKDTQKEPWFREINPNARIPALTDSFINGQTIRLFESGSIMQYLVEQIRPRAQNLLTPKPAREKYESQTNWLILPKSRRSGPNARDKRNHFLPPTHPERKIPLWNQIAIRMKLEDSIELLDKPPERRSARLNLVGNKCTIADIAHWGWIAALMNSQC
ncbi:MAG: hypothetical protein Q9186_006842 [Xanthomendoza sp. 1 TL-2023]